MCGGEGRACTGARMCVCVCVCVCVVCMSVFASEQGCGKWN